MIEEHQYRGAIDADSPDQKILPGFHRTSRNIVWKGTPQGMRAESAQGTTAIPNPNLPNSGINFTIGSFYDPSLQRIFTFNWNSLGTHGIYVFYTQTQTWFTVLQQGTNTVGTVLNFTATTRIHSIDIIYGDNNTGDLLFFIDSLSIPRKLNVNRFLGLTGFVPYTNITPNLINVIKAPPVAPPRVTYENDLTVFANNLLNSLFQFAYTFIYDDNEESVLSSASIVPLPTQQFSNIVNLPVSEDSRIAVYLQTGDQNVTKIRLYMRQTQNGVTSGWFIVDTIVKASNGIIANSIYRYVFYNNGNYVQADPTFTVLNYDILPQKAGCQSLLNGNVISYGNITEGYPYFSSSFSANITGVSIADFHYILNGVLFFADFNGSFTAGQPNIQIFLTGTAINDANGNPKTLEYAPQNLYVNATSNGSSIGFSYGNSVPYDIPTILSGIATAAASAGWTLLTTNPNSIVIYYPTGTIALQSTRIENRNLAANNLTYQLALFPQSGYQYGVIYRDANGITNGVITDISASITTLPFNQLSSTTITTVNLNLGSITPPPWATYYHIVRTNTLTYNKFLMWVSNQATTNFGQLVVNQYAYISISNITDYNLSIQATQSVVGYQFVAGDRIKFLGLYKLGGATFVPLNLDYEILGVATNPIINGTQQTGTFIQIQYPTADIGVNFNFISDSTDPNYANYQNYLIQIYNVASNTSPQTANTGSTIGASGNVYYEVGQQYGIGNPGTNTAFHYGNLANNRVIFNDGDCFARQRTVPAGQTYYIDVTASNFSNRYVTPLIKLAAPISTTAYTINQQPGASADPFNFNVYPTFGSPGGLYLNTSGVTQQIRLRGTIQATAANPTWMDIYAKVDNSNGTGKTITILHRSNPISTVSGTSVDITFDATFGVPAGAKMWFIIGNGNQVTNLGQQGFQLRLDIITNITIQVFDKSFSDVFNLVTNSDNRPNVQDTYALTTTFSTLFRYSQPYVLGTNINNTNRFYPNNFDEFDKSFGTIIRMRARQKELRVFQRRRVGRVGIFANFIKNNAGTMNLVTTDSIITQNNIQYFEGEFGLTQASGLISSGFADYGCDTIKGVFWRVSQDGMVDITHELSQGSKIQTFAATALPKYLQTFTGAFGNTASVLGVFNFTQDRDSEAIWVLQGGTNASGTIPGQSIAFVENGNRWSSFYDFVPDSIVCAETTLYSFFNGVMYVHNNTTTYCNYYGVQYQPQLTIIKNENPLMKKKWMSVAERSNTVWEILAINTDLNSYGSQTQQLSNLFNQDFQLLENKFYAPFYRDINSVGGLINGDPLGGTILTLNLQNTAGSTFAYLSMVEVKYIPSAVVENESRG